MGLNSPKIEIPKLKEARFLLIIELLLSFSQYKIVFYGFESHQDLDTFAKVSPSST